MPQHAVPAETTPLVMLVEDDGDSREMYAFSLESSGVRVVPLSDARTALEQSVSLRPSVVVTDLRLPGVDGFEFCRRLKGRPITASIPVIAVTGLAGPRWSRATHEAGFDLVLVKPCPPDVLLEAIWDVLARAARLTVQSGNAAIRSQRARQRATGAALRGQILECRSGALDGQCATIPCPACEGPIRWLESNVVGGIQFDYFAACERGCGEYCFDHSRKRFVRLR